jgi:hypothetical protein
MPFDARQHEGRPAVLSGGAQAGAGRYERRSHGRMALSGDKMQRRPTICEHGAKVQALL